MLFIILTSSVNWVHWIRARAQKNRWREEHTLVGYEMQWTIRYYIHCAKMWEDRAGILGDIGDAGATAYACQKMMM